MILILYAFIAEAEQSPSFSLCLEGISQLMAFSNFLSSLFAYRMEAFLSPLKCIFN